MSRVAAGTVRTNPFPGLRPFREDEEHLFFGRESQVDAMVDKLAATRFLAVVGASGGGKSSLVNCGLRPGLHGGLMASAGTTWRMAQFRPGREPMAELARALAEPGVLFRDHQADGMSLTDIVDTTLRMSTLGLIDIFEQAQLGPDVNLLVVVDQFEELFRFQQVGREGRAGVGEDASAFVKLLLEAKRQTTHPIFVVLTMRSDFLGDCARFAGLAEAINAGQYLVPRMTRDERRAAVVGPVRVGGGAISRVLLTRLVNDVGDNPDQLSILQHALNRTWANWEHEGGSAGPLDLVHYRAIGTMTRALDQHAEKAFAELATERQKAVCGRLFRALTDRASDPRGVRRPTTLRALRDIVGATDAEFVEVIEVFRRPSRAFLMPPAGEDLHDDTVVDISHESLMRTWRRLRTWSREEARSAQLFRRLADAAQRYREGKASLLRDLDLRLALDWRERETPSAAWAERYHPGFAAAMDYLEESRRAEEATVRRARNTRRTIRMLVVAACVVLAGITIWAMSEQHTAETQFKLARSRQIASASGTVEQADGMLSLLLAVEAVRTGVTPEAIRELHDSLPESHERLTLWHPKTVRYAAWNAAGDRIMTYCIDGRARLWSYGSDAGHVTATFLGVSSVSVSGARWDSEGTRALIGRGDQPIQWLGAQDEPIDDVPILGVEAADVAPAGPVWDGAGQVKTVIEASIAMASGDDVPMDFIRGHLARVTHVARSSPLDHAAPILTVSEDNTGRIWHADGSERAVLRGHSGSILHGAWHPDGKHVITSSKDATVRVWEIDVLLEPAPSMLADPEWTPTVASWGPGGESLLLADDHGAVRFHPDVRGDPARFRRLVGRDGAIRGGIRTIDWLREDDPTAPVKILATAGDDTARAWIVSDGAGRSASGHEEVAPALEIPGSGPETCIAWTGTAALLRLVGAEGILERYRDLAGEPEVFRLPRDPDWTPIFARWSPDEMSVLLADREGDVRLYAVAPELTDYVRLTGHEEEIRDVDWYTGADGLRPAKILTTSFDHTARIWSYPSSIAGDGTVIEPDLVLIGHQTDVVRGRWDRRGERVLTLGGGGAAIIWNESGQEIALLGARAEKVRTAFWLDDGSLRVIHRDGSARVWPGTVAALLEVANARIALEVWPGIHPRPRVLTAEERRIYAYE